MALTVNVTAECDRCGDEENDELRIDQTAEDWADDQGWQRTGTLLDKLLCPACVEMQDNNEEDKDG